MDDLLLASQNSIDNTFEMNLNRKTILCALNFTVCDTCFTAHLIIWTEILMFQQDGGRPFLQYWNSVQPSAIFDFLHL